MEIEISRKDKALHLEGLHKLFANTENLVNVGVMGGEYALAEWTMEEKEKWSRHLD